MDEKKYNEEGYLIVSEMDSCPLWEKDTILAVADVTTVAFSVDLRIFVLRNL